MEDTAESSWEQPGCYGMAAYDLPVVMILKYSSWKQTFKPHGCLATLVIKEQQCIFVVSPDDCVFPCWWGGWGENLLSVVMAQSWVTESSTEGSLTVVLGSICTDAKLDEDENDQVVCVSTFTVFIGNAHAWVPAAGRLCLPHLYGRQATLPSFVSATDRYWCCKGLVHFVHLYTVISTSPSSTCKTLNYLADFFPNNS